MRPTTPFRFVPSLEPFDARINPSAYAGSHALYQDIAVPTASADDPHKGQIELISYSGWDKVQEVRSKWFAVVDRTPIVDGPNVVYVGGQRAPYGTGVQVLLGDGSVRGLPGGSGSGGHFVFGDGSVRFVSQGATVLHAHAADSDVVAKGSLVKENAADTHKDESITIHGSRTE